MALIDTILSQITNAKYGREVRQAIHDGIQQCYADAIVGIKGDQGTSITSVARTSGNGAEGTTDIYTITFSNNTSSTFQVRHGSKGSTGLTGDKGAKGDKGDTIVSIIRTAGNGAEGTVDTYTITMSSGDTSTFQVRNGSKGSTGDTGPKGDKGDQGVSITNIVRTSGTGAEGTTDVYTITLSNGVQSTFNVRNGSKGNQGIQGPIGNTGATGPKGDPGVSITNIVRTSGTGEEGTTDIYTIYLSSGASQTFTVKHGSRGPVGATGVGIRDVRKISGTGAEGTVDTYAVMLSDGENKNFDVRHGSKGSTGSKGDPGKGVVGINKVSGTGAPGTVDTYAISYTDGSVTNFNVYNGADGAGSPTAQKLANARALTIGAVSKLFDGSEDITWSLEELDLAQRLHTHTTSQITDFPTEMPASDVYEWAKAQTKPTYTPTEVGAASEFHQHTTSDITNFPSSMPASDVEAWAKALNKPSYTPAEVGAAPVLHNHTTGSITDFPETMPPSPHAHSTNDITDFPTEMPASDVSEWAKAATKPTYTPSEVGAAEAIHNHTIADLTNLIVGGTNLVPNSDYAQGTSGWYGDNVTISAVQNVKNYPGNGIALHTPAISSGLDAQISADITPNTALVSESNYTVGFWLYGTTSIAGLLFFQPGLGAAGTFDVPTTPLKTVMVDGDYEWAYYEATCTSAAFYTLPSPRLVFAFNGQGYVIRLARVMLVKGTIATDWSPAPQDKLDVTAKAADSDKIDGVHLADIRLGQNILHNWDFRKPINQRSANGEISTTGHFLDRWILNSGSVIIGTDKIALRPGGNISQRIEKRDFSGKTVTFSIMVPGVGIYKGTTAIPNEGTGTVIYWDSNYAGVSIYYYSDYLMIEIVANVYIEISAVKLELGTSSTLHLDPPMDWAVEVPKCQRFFVMLDEYPTAEFIINTSTNAELYLRTPVQMRAVPTLSHTEFILRIDGANHPVNITDTRLSPTGIRFITSGTGLAALTSGVGYMSTLGGKGTLSADL